MVWDHHRQHEEIVCADPFRLTPHRAWLYFTRRLGRRLSSRERLTCQIGNRDGMRRGTRQSAATSQERSCWRRHGVR